MEPSEEQQQTTKTSVNDKTERKRRFQIVKLEDRIAPKQGSSHRGCSSYNDTVVSGGSNIY